MPKGKLTYKEQHKKRDIARSKARDAKYSRDEEVALIAFDPSLSIRTEPLLFSRYDKDLLRGVSVAMQCPNAAIEVKADIIENDILPGCKIVTNLLPFLRPIYDSFIRNYRRQPELLIEDRDEVRNARMVQ